MPSVIKGYSKAVARQRLGETDRQLARRRIEAASLAAERAKAHAEAAIPLMVAAVRPKLSPSAKRRTGK